MSKSFDIHKPLDLTAGVSKSGNRSWAITVEKCYCDAMLRGDKTAEVRTRVPMMLGRGDIVYVIQKDTGGKVVCRFVVSEVIHGKTGPLWVSYKEEMCISWIRYADYADWRKMMYLIRFEKLQKPDRVVFREDLGLLRSPHWFMPVSHCNFF